MKVLNDVEPDRWELEAMLKNVAMARESRFYAVDTQTGRTRLKAMQQAWG